MSAVRTNSSRVAVANKPAAPTSWWTFWESSRLSLRRLLEASMIHSADFKMSRFQSVLSLLVCERTVVRPGAMCSVSRVPTRRDALLAVASLAVWICVPALTLVVLVGAEGNLVARLALLISVWLLAAAGIGSCIQKILGARRWRGFGGRGVVVSNVAVDARGVGLARGLLAEVARVADGAGCTLLLAVRANNRAAVALYRSLGFGDDSRIPIRPGQVAMARPPADADVSDAIGLVDTPVARVVVAGCAAVAMYLLAAATSISWPARVAVVCALMVFARAALVDIKTHRLRNGLVVGAAVFVGLAVSLAASMDSALLAAGMGSAPFLLIHLVDPSAFGFGDVKFAAVAGALMATWWWPAAIVMVLVALGCGCTARLVRPGGPLPFGPSLFAGTLAAVVASIVLVEKGLVR